MSSAFALERELEELIAFAQELGRYDLVRDISEILAQIRSDENRKAKALETLDECDFTPGLAPESHSTRKGMAVMLKVSATKITC